jgi:hypothetical protein
MFSPQRIVSGIVVALSVAAISAPAAAATIVAGAPGPSGRQRSAPSVTVYSRQDKQLVPPAKPTAAPVLPAARAPRFTAPTGTFGLTDAAITTGSVVALLLVLGGGLAVSRRRTHRGAALTH